MDFYVLRKDALLHIEGLVHIASCGSVCSLNITASSTIRSQLNWRSISTSASIDKLPPHDVTGYPYSIWYDPTATEIGFNERKSVTIFENYAALTGLDSVKIKRVNAMILATIHHDIPSSSDPISGVFP